MLAPLVVESEGVGVTEHLLGCAGGRASGRIRASSTDGSPSATAVRPVALIESVNLA